MSWQGQRHKVPPINKKKTQPVGLSHLIGINGWSYEAEPVKMAAPSLSLSLSGLGLDVALAETLTDGCFRVSRWHEAFIFHFCEFLEEMTVSRGGRPSWSTHWSLKNNCHFAPDATSAPFWPSLDREPGDISPRFIRTADLWQLQNGKSLGSININKTSLVE